MSESWGREGEGGREGGENKRGRSIDIRVSCNFNIYGRREGGREEMRE